LLALGLFTRPSPIISRGTWRRLFHGARARGSSSRAQRRGVGNRIRLIFLYFWVRWCEWSLDRIRAPDPRLLVAAPQAGLSKAAGHMMPAWLELSDMAATSPPLICRAQGGKLFGQPVERWWRPLIGCFSREIGPGPRADISLTAARRIRRAWQSQAGRTSRAGRRASVPPHRRLPFPPRTRVGQWPGQAETGLDLRLIGT